MDKEILDELKNIADDFWHDKKTLDRNRIENISRLVLDGFGRNFDETLKNFLEIKNYDVTKSDPVLDKILGINSIKDYFDACEKFLKVVTTAKTNNLIIDKQTIKELDDYKEKYSKLEEILNRKESIIKQQENIINTYVTQIANAVKVFPDLDKFFGIQDGDVG